jgi:hypothetical protein
MLLRATYAFIDMLLTVTYASGFLPTRATCLQSKHGMDCFMTGLAPVTTGFGKIAGSSCNASRIFQISR